MSIYGQRLHRKFIVAYDVHLQFDVNCYIWLRLFHQTAFMVSSMARLFQNVHQNRATQSTIVDVTNIEVITWKLIPIRIVYMFSFARMDILYKNGQFLSNL